MLGCGCVLSVWIIILQGFSWVWSVGWVEICAHSFQEGAFTRVLGADDDDVDCMFVGVGFEELSEGCRLLGGDRHRVVSI